ncbi:MAG TPA: peptide chain release factor N(5)-glutamine methyltransferase [Chitinophagaceae bacterium]
MTLLEATTYCREKLQSIYEEGEAAVISEWLIEYLTGIKKTDRVNQKNNMLPEKQQLSMQSLLDRLLTHEPIQYVLNEAWFCGLKLYVDKNVLIPRPETEELVEWIIANCKFPVDELKILDIGTGSGCISIALKRRVRKAEVWSCDVSDGALMVAKKNAAALGTEINFLQLDFLDEQQVSSLPSFDIIVSNPPYVPVKDKAQMQPNVVNYEPATALFVPDNDPLVFYKAIAAFGKQKLNPGGVIYFEIHEGLAASTIDLLQSSGYTAELKKDMQGKDRMIRASF